jgi:outer membrane protein OmpA-like peptidoglycan-associated protein
VLLLAAAVSAGTAHAENRWPDPADIARALRDHPLPDVAPIRRPVPRIDAAPAGIDLEDDSYENDFSNIHHLEANVAPTQKGYDERVKVYVEGAGTIKYEPKILKDEKGNEFISNEKTIKIDLVTIQEKRKEMLGDFEIERFSLILFDFDKANIDGNNKNIVEFIKNRIKTNSEIEITGYTDRTGEAQYNKNLSTKRSENTKKALGIESAIFNGLGSEVTLYNNNLPEGRFYCRTVNVLVKTKVN